MARDQIKGKDGDGGASLENIALLDPRPEYPEWAKNPDKGGDPDIARVLTATLINLRSTLGGESLPATVTAKPVPYTKAIDPAKAGVDKYEELETQFGKIAAAYDAASVELVKAVEKSRDKNLEARAAISSAIEAFNSLALRLQDGDFKGLVLAEVECIDTVRAKITGTIAPRQSIIEDLHGGPSPVWPQDTDSSGTAPASTTVSAPAAATPAAPPTRGDNDLQTLIDRLTTTAAVPTTAPAVAQQSPAQQQQTGGTPFTATTGNPLTGTPSSSDLTSQLKTLVDAATAKAGDDTETPKPTPTPAATAQPPASPSPSPQQAPVQAPTEPQSDTPPTPRVTLPDGTAVPADDQLHADIAQKATTDTTGTQDQAAAIYDAQGKPIPADTSTARVDPLDAKPGAYLKWDDGTTRVVVAPGLISDGHGGTTTLEDAMKRPGLTGAFDPYKPEPEPTTQQPAAAVAQPLPTAAPATKPATAKPTAVAPGPSPFA